MNDSLKYKDYVGDIRFSEADGIFHGKVSGIKSLITFEGDSVSTLTNDFFNAIDEYLAFCEENNITPEFVEDAIRTKVV